MRVRWVTLRQAGIALATAWLLGGVPALRVAWAGSEERKATGGASELLIPVGPRGVALGEPVSGDVSGVEALFWNPAGLAGLEGTEAQFDHTQYFGGMKVNYAAVGTRWGTVGTFGFDAKVLSIGDIIETTEDAPEGTGNTFSPTFAVLGVTFGRAFSDRVRFGATVDYVSESILDASAHGAAFDFGVQYITGFRDLQFGLAMKNFGPGMEFRGSSFELSFHRPDSDPTSTNRTFVTASTPFDLPSFFTLAGSMNVLGTSRERLTLMSSFQSNTQAGDQLSGAAELAFHDLVALRASWFGTFRGATNPLTGVETTGFSAGDDLYNGYALGAGVNVRAGGTRFAVDFAWRPVREVAFDDITDFGLKVKF
jgi:hypothetical protein